MTIKTVDGEEIDTESPEWKQYLRLSAIEDAHPNIPDPAPYRTLGDVIELERRRREREAREASQNRSAQEVREAVPA